MLFIHIINICEILTIVCVFISTPVCSRRHVSVVLQTAFIGMAVEAFSVCLSVCLSIWVICLSVCLSYLPITFVCLFCRFVICFSCLSLNVRNWETITSNSNPFLAYLSLRCLSVGVYSFDLSLLFSPVFSCIRNWASYNKHTSTCVSSGTSIT